MNREILFRGKRIDNGEWVYGDYVKPIKICFISIGLKNASPELIEVIPETVGQFTGLTDKNGTKIFEGDKYKTDSWPGMEFTIKFVNGSFCGGTEENGYEPMGYSINQESETIEPETIEPDEFASTITITGNIHDNPTT